ncbi:hypothetical protein BDY17DRAFT_151281 [Neohortaea acidophila]|uniref:BRCT domain-containing protein n=1 Tax=Neohortaea acidophila TaxID=245834 RepID=A0A6A6PV69_9PEZI|nr:uncharacterized protein BDY17DRAFT_151281 [Neohortaea acidophila]KAF2483624.1 hypothetical protein BDY17DRAFT_151281 [Neohortaea acidophila]
MAADADGSVGSVPLAHLALLRDKLLQAPETNRATAESTAMSISQSPSKNTSVGLAASVPETVDATLTPHAASLRPPPRMGVSKSATGPEMKAMMNPAQSQEASLTRASSFHGYPGGDTQPMESQVYRDFNASVIFPALVTPVKAAFPQMSVFEETCDDNGVDVSKTPHTCAEGETGFIDLENAMPSPGAQSVSSLVEGFATSPQTALRFTMPETPAIPGHNRRHSSEILTSVTTAQKYPAFSQLFGGGHGGAMMSATQAFNQTQAPSSPMPDVPRSDPIITRPSPHLNHHFHTSSPIMTMSSPVATMRPSTASEPRDRYTSMRESQERRAARLRAEIGVARDFDDDILAEEEEEEMDGERLRFEMKRLQKVKSDQALAEFARFRAPSRHGSRPTSSPRQTPMIDLTTPATTKRDGAGDVAVLEKHSDVEDDDDEIEDALPEDEALVNEAQSDDEYDELSQAVLRSQGNVDEEVDDVESTGPDDVRDELEGSNENGPPASHVEDGGEQIMEDRPELATQLSAVADSQPQQQDGHRGSLRAPLKEPSSMASFVPGSQYAGKTSQDLARLQSRSILSSPPLPSMNARAASVTEVPESDLPQSDDHHDTSLRAATTTTDSNRNNSNNQAPFSTAQTHVSCAATQKQNSALSPLKILQSQRSMPASQSPLTAAGVRRFADIAAAASQSPLKGGLVESEVNVDAIMDDFITAEDQEYLQAVSSPPSEPPLKRRRMARGLARNVAAESDAAREHATMLEQAPAAAVDADEVRDREVQVAAPTAEPLIVRALQESPSKANEMLPATPESVMEREKAGSKAVSQLLSKRARKPTEKLRTYQVKKVVKPTSAKGKKTTVAASSAAPDENVTTPAVPEDQTKEDQSGVVAPDAGAESTGPVVQSPTRIFAFFKGQYNKYYPATWLSMTSSSTHRVKFDDTTVAIVDAHHICRLELQVNDQIKVDLPDMRNKTWLVKAFGPAIQTPKTKDHTTDVYGRALLQVQAKSSRTSVPSSTAEFQAEGEVVDIPVSSVYLTPTMWSHFKDRMFVPPATSVVDSRAATPSAGVRTPDVTTPTSRARRAGLQTGKAGDATTSHLREVPLSSAASNDEYGLFSGMAFAISYGANDAGKANVTHLIIRNGGLVLESGFDELFDLPFLDDAPPSPAKKSLRAGEQAERPEDDDTVVLNLKPEYQRLGFVALIADRHSRRAKYLQALALGIPTLSERWITDSLDRSRNPTLLAKEATATVLPWPKYLLPAGESAYLGGATRSRTMLEYSAKDAVLAITIEQRSVLLNADDGVLIVVPKKGKASWDRRKAYAFLTLALGAGRVKRVGDLFEAKALSSHDDAVWRWIYVDGAVGEAGEVVNGKAGKKRKRDDEGSAKAGGGNLLSVGDGRVKIVNDEFVVQSLILGALAD